MCKLRTSYVENQLSPFLEPLVDEQAGLVSCARADGEALAESIETLWRRLQQGWQPGTREIFDARLSSAVITQRIGEELARP